MYYLKFTADKGAEHNISCYAYNIMYRSDNTMSVTVNIKDIKGIFEKSFSVGPETDWTSVFVMNIGGQTIDKHCFNGQ